MKQYNKENNNGEVTIEEFASFINLPVDIVKNLMILSDQYGNINTPLPNAASIRDWLNLACNCDLLYGDVCLVHRKLATLDTKQYVLK